MSWVSIVIFCCFFLSGLSSLIYEVLWMRMLILIFGSTTFAISTVLTAFMGGLALGSYCFGRFIDRARHPVLIYGGLEALIGLYALQVPIIFNGLIPFYQWIWLVFHPSFYLYSLIQFFLVGLVLIVPTAMMGATLPILSKFYSHRTDRLGLAVGTLYAINTLGGIMGTFFSGFFFLPLLGVRLTTYLAASLNLLIGIIVFFLVKQRGVKEEEDAPAKRVLAASDLEGEKISRGTHWMVLIAFGLSGFASMVYEVTWSRILAMILDSSTYAFTTMLTTFLVGIAIGSYVMSRIIDRLHRPLVAFILLEGAIGGAAFGGLYLFAELPYLFVVLYRNWGDSMNLIFLSKFLLTFLVMFIPTLLIGALFPIVVKLYTTHLERVGRSIGEVYSLNTLGCILGSFGAGFIFVPMMGIQNAILIAIGLNFLLTFLLLWASPYRIPSVKCPLTLVLLAGILVLAFHIPPWRPALMSSGVYMYVRFVQDLDRQQLFESYTKDADPLLFYQEGYTATVSVHKSKTSENIYLKVNGKVEASTVGDMPTQVLLSQIPMLFSKSQEDVLVIGLGSGVTVGSAATHPARRIKVVELEPAVVAASKYFEPVNHRVLSDPRVQVIAQDARNYLLVTPETFDVIISEPSNPWMAGVSNLFTREFLILGSRRLKEGGLFCQWLQLYKISPDNLRSILGTFNSVFPNILIFESLEYDLFLLGSFEPLNIDIDFLNRRLSQPNVQADLERIGIKSARDILSHFLFGSQEIPLFSQGAPINTDDNALLEFSAPKTLYLDTSEANFKEISKYSQGFHPYMRR